MERTQAAMSFSLSIMWITQMCIKPRRLLDTVQVFSFIRDTLLFHIGGFRNALESVRIVLISSLFDDTCAPRCFSAFPIAIHCITQFSHVLWLILNGGFSTVEIPFLTSHTQMTKTTGALTGGLVTVNSSRRRIS